MALQRNNFRCPRDGVLLPVSPLRSGNTSSSSSAGVVISHADLPPRQRRRVHVGSTNLSRTVSTPELPPPVVASVEENDGGDVSSAAHHICETNIDLLKQSMGTTSSSSPSQLRHSVVYSEKRRLEQLSPHGCQQQQQQQPRLTLDGQRSRSPSHQQEENHTTIHGPSNGTSLELETDKEPSVVERAFLTDTRQKLYNAFVHRYGSVRSVFKAFDRDSSGLISLQRFADMVEASQVALSPADVKKVFRHVDINDDHSIEYQEFSEMFTASEYVEHASAYSPSKAKAAAVTADITSSLALKFRAPLDLSPQERERMKELRLKVNGELLHKQGGLVSVHGGKTENLLIYAFKQFDTDNDGFVSYDQVKSALGKDYLQLSIDPQEMDEMVRMVDRNADEKISMKEFVQYFGAGKRELPTDFIDNGRRKELAALHVRANAPLTPRQQFDPEYYSGLSETAAKATAAAVLPSVQAEPATQGCMQENLTRRIATSPMFRMPPSSLTKERAIRAQTSHAQLSVSHSTPSLSTGDAGRGVRPRSKNDLGPTLNPLVVVSQDRFEYWRQQRTDWSRVGMGGDGVQPGTALFASESERFQTTASAAFSPMRRGVNSGDVFRDAKSTSTLEAEARAARRQAKHDHTEKLLLEMDHQHAKDQHLTEWKARAKVRLGAEKRFQYLDKVHDQQQRVAMREQQMAKRHGGIRYHRMWAGSPDSQFNNTHVTGESGEQL